MASEIPRSFSCFCFFSFIVVSLANDQCVMKCIDFMGTTDFCITSEKKCDTFPDCRDHEDEEDCGCRGFVCQSNGWCIDLAERCNGHVNCDDRSDEAGCTKAEYKIAHPSLPEADLCKKPCGAHGFCSFLQNETAICVCDNQYSGSFCENRDLKQTSFVTPSSIEQFHCGNLNLPMSEFCDGKVDCADRSDEVNCTRDDYNRAKPHHSQTRACLMPCGSGTCEFGSSHRAHCSCPDSFEGVFCENRILTTSDRPSTTVSGATTPNVSTLPDDRHNKLAYGSNNFVSTIALPVVAVGGVGVLLWMVIAKPWASASRMGESIV